MSNPTTNSSTSLDQDQLLPKSLNKSQVKTGGFQIKTNKFQNITNKSYIKINKQKIKTSKPKDPNISRMKPKFITKSKKVQVKAKVHKTAVRQGQSTSLYSVRTEKTPSHSSDLSEEWNINIQVELIVMRFTNQVQSYNWNPYLGFTPINHRTVWVIPMRD